MRACSSPLKSPQRGVAAVEFALVIAILLVLVFGVIEFGRLFFTLNSAQEVTRRAAREQVVLDPEKWRNVQRLAVLRPPDGTGDVYFPGSPDISNNDVELTFLDENYQEIPVNKAPTGNENLNNCLTGNANCIRYVRATLKRGDARVPFEDIALFVPMGFGIAPMDEDFLLPYSTVIMPAEALGLRVN